MSIDTDIANSWAYLSVNPRGILPDADLNTYQMKTLGKDALPTCSRVLEDYRKSIGYYRTARAYALLLGGLGGTVMLGGCSLLKGPSAGLTIAAGVVFGVASYHFTTTVMPMWMNRAEADRRLFHTMCMEPKAAPVPVQVPQNAARQWVLPESVRASLSRPIAIPEIRELRSSPNFVSQHAEAIGLGVAAVALGAVVALIVAGNATGVGAALDPAIPGIMAASAAFGTRSAQLFAR